VSRSATLAFRDRKKNADEIAQALGATLLVDGALQRSGDKLRVTLSLVHPESRVIAWSRSYDGSFANLFALQQEVAQAVADALALTLTPGDRARLRDTPTANVEAFADYAQGRTFLERPDVADNLDRSIKLFQSAISRDPRFAGAHGGLGEAYWRKYQATRDETWSVKARDAITDALRLDPNAVQVRLSLASVYRGMGRLPEATDELRRVVAAQPRADEPHRLLGQVLLDAGKKDEGLAEIRKAIALRPNYWGHHHTLGIAYYNAGDYPDAVASFRRVTELQPDNAWGYQMLGTAYHAMDDAARAIPNYERAIKLGNSKAYSNLGVLYSSVGRLEDAARTHGEALKLDPKSPIKHHNLGEVLARMGLLAEARTEFRAAIDLSKDQLRVNPRDVQVMATLAVVEAKTGAGAEADRHIGQAISLAPDDGDVRYSEAVVRTLTGHLDGGISALEKALAHGYSASRAASDPNLSALWKDARFRQLVGRLPERKGGAD
jgi:tetratricopeptide (TPR) repeat protein